MHTSFLKAVAVALAATFTVLFSAAIAVIFQIYIL